MNDNTEVVVDERAFWAMGASFFMLALAVGCLVVSVVLWSRQGASLAEQAHKADLNYSASCSYLQFLKDQVSSSQKYLKLHPNGAPALGLSATYIQQQIDKQQAAVNSLAVLRCP